MVGRKKVIMVLSKKDLADPSAVSKFTADMNAEGIAVAAINSLNGQGSKEVIQLIRRVFQEQADKMQQKGRKVRPARVMVAGVPNVGKSTFLNCIVGKRIAQTGAKPGVTRGQQWIRIRSDIEFMDTPGLMWPKVENEEQGKKLALLNIVGENAYEEYDIALYMLKVLKDKNPNMLIAKFKLTDLDESEEQILEKISLHRGHLLKGGIADLEKTCKILLQDFRKGNLGPISLDESYTG